MTKVLEESFARLGLTFAALALILACSDNMKDARTKSPNAQEYNFAVTQWDKTQDPEQDRASGSPAESVTNPASVAEEPQKWPCENGLEDEWCTEHKKYCKGVWQTVNLLECKQEILEACLLKYAPIEKGVPVLLHCQNQDTKRRNDCKQMRPKPPGFSPYPESSFPNYISWDCRSNDYIKCKNDPDLWWTANGCVLKKDFVKELMRSHECEQSGGRWIEEPEYCQYPACLDKKSDNYPLFKERCQIPDEGEPDPYENKPLCFHKQNLCDYTKSWEECREQQGIWNPRTKECTGKIPECALPGAVNEKLCKCYKQQRDQEDPRDEDACKATLTIGCNDPVAINYPGHMSNPEYDIHDPKTCVYGDPCETIFESQQQLCRDQNIKDIDWCVRKHVIGSKRYQECLESAETDLKNCLAAAKLKYDEILPVRRNGGWVEKPYYGCKPTLEY